MPKKLTKESEPKVTAETPKKRTAAPKTSTGMHKRATTTKPAAEALAVTTAVETAPQLTPPVAPTTEQIAKVAYFLWLDRDGSHGDARDDWFRAEAIVLSNAR